MLPTPHNPLLPLNPGDTLQERYRITRLLERGGLNCAYEALDLFQHDPTQMVFVREMRFNPAMSVPQRKTALDTFRRAVDFLMALSHPGIPKTLDSFDQRGRVYLVTQMPPGMPLQARIDAARSASEPLAPAQALRWGLGLCDVLDYLHTLGGEPFVVSNVAPPNIYSADDGRVALVEFGINKVFVHQMLDTNIGLVGYAPPELYLGEISPQTDVYGVGATLHHALTGSDPRLHAPFSFDERPLRALNPAVSPALAAVVMQALHPLPRERYADCRALKDALHAAG